MLLIEAFKLKENTLLSFAGNDESITNGRIFDKDDIIYIINNIVYGRLDKNEKNTFEPLLEKPSWIRNHTNVLFELINS